MFELSFNPLNSYQEDPLLALKNVEAGPDAAVGAAASTIPPLTKSLSLLLLLVLVLVLVLIEDNESRTSREEQNPHKNIRMPLSSRHAGKFIIYPLVSFVLLKSKW